jgi:Leucine-rich repeat (LRR) protein
LDLENTNLGAPLTATALSNLTRLTSLTLLDAQLVGPIPDALCGLTRLTSLQLTQNQLNASIPWCIGNLTRLVHLFLEYNQLSGPLPESLGALTSVPGQQRNQRHDTGELRIAR